MTLQHVSLEIRARRRAGRAAVLGAARLRARSSRRGTLAEIAAWVQRDGTQIHLLFADEPVVPPSGHAAVVGGGLRRDHRRAARRGLRPAGAHAPLGRRARVRPQPGGSPVELMAEPPPREGAAAPQVSRRPPSYSRPHPWPRLSRRAEDAHMASTASLPAPLSSSPPPSSTGLRRPSAPARPRARQPDRPRLASSARTPATAASRMRCSRSSDTCSSTRAPASSSARAVASTSLERHPLVVAAGLHEHGQAVERPGPGHVVLRRRSARRSAAPRPRTAAACRAIRSATRQAPCEKPASTTRSGGTPAASTLGDRRSRRPRAPGRAAARWRSRGSLKRPGYHEPPDAAGST